MAKKSFTMIALLVVCFVLSNKLVNAQRRMENLGRGVVAVRSASSSVFISWRLLGNDPRDIGFNVYRTTAGGTATKLNSSVLTGGTNYTDNAADLTKENAYFVKPVLNGTEQAASGSFTLTANHATEPCVVVPLKSGNTIHFVWVGDLDGDGEYDYLVDRLNWTNGVKIEAYKRDGTCLWTVDMGPNSLNMDNIMPGSATIDVGHWDGATVYDMDGDGKAEVLLRTANGVIFGDGKTLTYGNDNIQFISVVDGLTGVERVRAQVPNNYLSAGPMGCQMGIGYLNGITPSLITFMKNRNPDKSFNRLACAWDFDGDSLRLKWKTNMSFGTSYGGGSDGHQMRIVDVNGDGKDDLAQIGFVLNGEDGSLLYNLGKDGIGHGDRFFIGKLDPDRPGLQGYGIQQYNVILDYYYDAGTGKVLWKHTTKDGSTGDVGRGSVGDVDPSYPGYEVWEFAGLFNGPTNTLVSSTYAYPNLRIWWDGDLLSENLNDGKLEKYQNQNVSRLLTTWHYQSATGSDRNVPMFYGDIMGDWREEAIYTSSDFSKLVIFTTPTPCNYRFYTLAHNPAYRNSMTIKGYLQSHMPDYYLGYGMTPPPTPPMQSAKSIWKGGLSDNEWNISTTANWIVNGTSGTYTQGDDVMFDISGAPNTSVVLNGHLTPSSIKVISPVNYSFGGNGSITGTTGILKSGAGSLSLNSKCSYSDTTRVEQGAFYVNDSLTKSPVLVSHGASLGGSGTIVKPVFLDNGALLSPGARNQAGKLSFSGSLTIPANSTCIFDITDDSTGTVKPSDKIVITGNLTVSDILNLQINKIDDTIKAGAYPLISYSGTFSGNLSKCKITGLFGRKYTLKDSVGTIYLTIKAARKPSKITWNGSSVIWDLQNTSAWSLNGLPETFVFNDTTEFGDAGASKPNVNVTEPLGIGGILVNVSENKYTFSGTGYLCGNGGLTKTGKGTLSMLLSANTYTGKTVIDSGRFEVASLTDAGCPSSVGADSSVLPDHFVLNNAFLKYAGISDIWTNRGLTLSGSSDTIEVTNSGRTINLRGVIAGNANLVKTGNGNLNLMNNTNSFTGSTIIKGGTLSLGDETARSVIFNGGTLTTYKSSSNYYTNLIVPSEYTGTFNTNAQSNYRGTLTGSGILNVYLPGSTDQTIFFGNWSAFAGTINIAGVASSTFRIANTYGYTQATLNLGSNVTMYHGGTGTGTGDGVATTVQIGALSGQVGSYLKDENWIIGAKNIDATFDGVISGNAITKVGTGAWTLTNANTYTGTTMVNGGTLIVNNTTGSGTGTGMVRVNNLGTLSGTGTISGSVTINTGGTIAPGNKATAPGSNTIGTLKINNTLTLNSGSKTSVEIKKLEAAVDLIWTTGIITFGGTLSISKLDPSSFAPGDSFKLFNAPGYRGLFSNIEPASPGTDLEWDTTSLKITGTIKIKEKTPDIPDNTVSVRSENIEVYPNPVNDKLYFTANIPIQQLIVQIKDLKGVQLQHKELYLQQSKAEFDLSALPKGIYLLRITINTSVIIKKVVKD